MSESPIASIVIQARMNSNRLPGKVLRNFGGKPMLIRLMERLDCLPPQFIKIVATSSLEKDDPVALAANAANWRTVRGSLENVIGRYIQALNDHPTPYIVRVTGDNPFTDFEALEDMVKLAEASLADYVYAPDLPIGTAAEVFSADCLRESFERAASDYQQEHINAVVHDNSSDFKIVRYQNSALPKDTQNVRLTVDTLEDFLFAEAVLDKLEGNMLASAKDVLFAAKELKHG